MTLPRSFVRSCAASYGTWILLVILIGGLSGVTRDASAQEAQVIDQIAAVVGDDIILQSEVEGLARSLVQQQPGLSNNAELRRQALNQLIDRAVLAARAQEDTTITVSDQELQNQLDQQVQLMVQQVGSEAELERMYGKSVLQLKEDFREDIREQILAQKFRATHMQTIDITPSEVQQWFERIPQDSLPQLPTTVRLAHIVRYPQPSQEAQDEAREIITAIRDSIVQGKSSFESMARRFSDDEGTAANGGRISGVSLSDLVPEFAAVASRTPIDEVSQVFYNDQQEGFHILRVNERASGNVDFNHILVRVNQASVDPTETINYLAAVRDTLQRTNATFALMARRHSEEAQSSENAGRVVDPRSGTRDLVLDALGPSWQSTIDTMKVGAVSQPTDVRLLNGDEAYHILKLQNRIPAHRVNLTTDYSRIKQFALQEKQNREMREWLDELRAETYVDIRMRFDTVAAARR